MHLKIPITNVTKIYFKVWQVLQKVARSYYKVWQVLLSNRKTIIIEKTGIIEKQFTIKKEVKGSGGTIHIKNTQLTFTCSKSTVETIDKYAKYIQSQQ